MLEQGQETAAGDVAVHALEPVPGTKPEPEPEPEDEVPPEYRVPAYAQGPTGAFLEPPRLSGPGLAVRAVAYSAAIAWPFLGTAYEYYTLNGSNTSSNICSEYGCVLAGTEFAHQALPLLLPASAVSALLVAGWNKGVRRLRENARVREPEDEKPPVPKIVIAGGFVAVCALAFIVGILRGVMISHLGY